MAKAKNRLENLAHPRASLLHTALSSIDEAGFRYCVLHGYEEFNRTVSSDVDCVIDHAVSIQDVVRCIERRGLWLVQHLEHESTCHYLVFYSREYKDFLQLDISSDYRRNSAIFYSGDDFLQTRRRYSYFWVPSPPMEFGYYLAKKLSKGVLTDGHGARLSVLYAADPKGCIAQLDRLFGGRSTTTVQVAAQNNDWAPVRNQIGQLRIKLLAGVRRQSSTRIGQFLVPELLRLARRFRQFTGVHVAFLGPDGAGKSTIIGEIEQSLKPAFRHTNVQHLFPISVANRRQVPDPQGRQVRGRLSSLAKMAYWWLRYTVGYAQHIRPKLVRSTLILSDRYFPDIFVDSKRYRYGGPSWLPRMVWMVLPKPDLFILLDAPAEVLQLRKQEVPFAETERQVADYRGLADSMSNGYIVDANRPISHVVADVNHIILGFMEQRTHRRLGLKVPSHG